ncbi:uncharacterized protein DUF3558 [Tamaricihabitans halophyticus]|uniref:Uncharacterized protein DUF3558 n=1 Tax=Tamaricihabitans halophyticus TaxID=1262583 RepID=A0A4R2QCV1_9PSEU|nr:DUF3558 domain-containing protein [Tamaricihabitans halophyticus]TCP46787.1 uncharacterized protein DUF3558 [Tamaricihabitans halophyticus]
MRSRAWHAVVLLSAAAVLLAGCAQPEDGEAVPAGGTPAATESSSGESSPGGNEVLPHSGAPAVTDPIDASRFVGEPCESLTSDQVGRLGLPVEGDESPAPYGRKCRWSDPAKAASASVGFLDDLPDGISSLYASREQNEVFEELEPIQGHPVVAFDSIDVRDRGSCGVALGLSDELMAQVAVNTSRDKRETSDPCEAAHRVATMAVETMKRGS